MLTKTVFLLKVSHIHLNYAFVCFEAFLGKFTEKFSFYSQNEYLRKKHRNIKKVRFSQHVWKGANPGEKLDLFKQLFLFKPIKGYKC